MRYSGKVEYAHTRKMREANTRLYRLAHWPLWIWVFFLAPGPLTFLLFYRGFGWANLTWLLAVLAGMLDGVLHEVVALMRECAGNHVALNQRGCRLRMQ